MPGELQPLLVGLLFVVSAVVWIAFPRYRRNTIVRAGLAIPLAGLGSMLFIGLIYTLLVPDF